MTSSLLIDIGNSRIKWRLSDPTCGDEPVDGAADVDAVDILAARWASSADRPVARAFLSNVADDAVVRAVEAAAIATWPGIVVTRVVATPSEAGVVNGYADPAQLGADRWLALIGAHAARPSTSLLVCTFGTATTIDLLIAGASGTRFEGGLILPGLAVMRRALVDATARLPDADGAVADFGVRTTDAIASGIVAAQAGAVAHALRRALHRAQSIELAISGGAASAMMPSLAALSAPCHLMPDLVLRGLAAIARDRRAGL